MSKVKLSSPVRISGTGEVTTIATLADQGRVRFTKDEEGMVYRAELIPDQNEGETGFWDISPTAYQSRTGEAVVGSASSESRGREVTAPSGRIGEHIAKLTDDERQRAAVTNSSRLGGDSILKVWQTRHLMAKVIRTEERRSPRSKWTPIVPLTDGEGY